MVKLVDAVASKATSVRSAGSSPANGTLNAFVVELEYTHVLETCPERVVGSNPTKGTKMSSIL